MRFLLLLLATVSLTVSCNKEFENVLPTSYGNDTLNVGDGSRRVLYIILDGVKGSAIKDIAPQNLTELTKRSIYTYDGIADYQRNNLTFASAWTTMLTGVDYTKHQVVSEDFSGFDNSKTPTLFTVLKSEINNVRSVAFSTENSWNTKLAKDATLAKNLADDNELKTAVVNELKLENPNLLVAQFHSADKAANKDYTVSNTAYVNAIKTIDGYIGEILTTLRARKTFSEENWLVVVASSKGGGVSGGSDGSNIYADESRNTFVAYYNPKFSPVAYKKPDVGSLPYAGSSPKFVGNGSNAAQTDAQLANFGSDKDATIRFNIRWDYGATFYPSFVTKRASFSSGVVGWTFFMEYGGGVGINFSQSGQGNTQRTHSRIISDGKWHNISARFWKEGSTRYVSLYVDGIPASQGRLNITNLGNIDTQSPLRLGSIGDNNVNCIINDLAIYDVAVPEDILIANSKKTPLTPNNDPYYNNLIGYWKGNEGAGTEIKDVLGKSSAFKLSENTSWSSFSDISPNISPEISPSAFMAVPNGVDIPVMIYTWMNVTIPSNWGLMGKFYNPIINLPKD